MKKIFLSVALFILTYNLNAQCVYEFKTGQNYGKDADVFSLGCNTTFAQANNLCETTNLGSKSALATYAWTFNGDYGQSIGFMEFDLTSLNGLNCTIQNAKLIFSHSQSTTHQNSGANAYKLQRVIQPWDEMTINYLNKPNFISSVAGKDYVSVPQSTSPYQGYEIDITEMANFWLAKPDSNFGFRMALDVFSTYKCVSVASREHPNPNLRPKLVITLTCANSCNNLIKGKIYHDKDNNCTFSTGDVALKNQLIKIEPGPIYAITDTAGNYESWVDIGNYTISPVPSSALYNATCTANYSVTFTTQGNTEQNKNFGFTTTKNCPILTVDAGAGRFRVNHIENIIVNYANEGNEPQANAYIDVELGSGLEYQSASISGTLVSGNTYRFEVGTLQPAANGMFYITVLVGDLTFGTSECVTAEIFPYTPCVETVSTGWDRSSVSIAGRCENDSLAIFTIYNTGSSTNGNMAGTSEYRIFRNDTLVYVGSFQLAGQDSLVITVVANGNTIRLEADQRPGHPGNSRPRETISSCGTPQSGITITSVNNTIADDEDLFKETFCLEIRNSYDPNDKHVSPIGITENKYISKTNELEYLINFQNTGNDTAYVVRITDVISDKLDLGTIRSGVSSHNYRFSIQDNRTIQWLFENINLVDSTTNEAKSHGFVKFKIKQKANNTNGTEIMNSASIYFDYNSPIITNSTYNMVFDAMLVNLNTSKKLTDSDFEFTLYPNPAKGKINVVVSSIIDTKFSLFDIQGRNLLNLSISTNEQTIDISTLESGIYFYQVESGKNKQVVGKLVVE